MHGISNHAKTEDAMMQFSSNFFPIHLAMDNYCLIIDSSSSRRICEKFSQALDFAFFFFQKPFQHFADKTSGSDDLVSTTPFSDVYICDSHCIS